MTLEKLLAEITRRALRRALRVSHGHRVKAALTLGISESKLHRLLRRHVGQVERDALAEKYGWPGVAERTAAARSQRRKPTGGRKER